MTIAESNRGGAVLIVFLLNTGLEIENRLERICGNCRKYRAFCIFAASQLSFTVMLPLVHALAGLKWQKLAHALLTSLTSYWLGRKRTIERRPFDSRRVRWDGLIKRDQTAERRGC